MPIRRTWVAASLHAGTQGAGHYWPRKIPGATHTQEWPGKAPGWIWANMAKGSQEQPGSSGATQEHPGVARKSSWLDLGILYPGKPTGSLHEPGSWGGGPRAARSSPGSSRSSPRAPRRGQKELLAGFGHSAQHGSGQPGAAQEAPGAAQEFPGVARRASWLDLGILGQHG